MAGKNKAIILDRDGTLIKERNYISRVGDIKILDGVSEALILLRDAGFKIIIATNQSGVARGFFNEKKVKKINKEVCQRLKRAGAVVDGVFYCPHHPDAQCACRKPAPGMIKEAQKRFNLDLKRSFCIGDKLTDVEFGKNAGLSAILLLTGYGAVESKKISKNAAKPDYVAPNMLAAAVWILKKLIKK